MRFSLRFRKAMIPAKTTVTLKDAALAVPVRSGNNKINLSSQIPGRTPVFEPFWFRFRKLKFE